MVAQKIKRFSITLQQSSNHCAKGYSTCSSSSEQRTQQDLAQPVKAIGKILPKPWDTISQ